MPINIKENNRTLHNCSEIIADGFLLLRPRIESKESAGGGDAGALENKGRDKKEFGSKFCIRNHTRGKET